MEIITSDQNIRVKKLLKLKEKSRERKKTGLFLIDGAREIKEAIAGGLIIEELYICSELSNENFNLETTELSLEIFKKVCYKEKPDGCLAVASRPDLGIESLIVKNKPLIVVLEAVEKPGNLGAIVRSAYAAGVDAIIINDEQTDIYNPNVIRASQGLLFKIPIITASLDQTLNFCKNNNIKMFGAALGGTKIYTETDFKSASAIILGTEADGLSDNWLNGADELVKIPMKPGIDSLNVSVSAAILIFEAWRQRGFN
jgi:TrmH family RNA methyltransferase